MHAESIIELNPARTIALPRMPSIVRYRDVYASRTRAIRDPGAQARWMIYERGRAKCIDFLRFPTEVQLLMRHVLADAFTFYEPSTVINVYEALLRLIDKLGAELLLHPLQTDLGGLREFWLGTILPELIGGRFPAQPMKCYLKFLCRNNISPYSFRDIGVVSSLPGPKKDLYASVRSNEVFLSNAEQLSIVNYLDDAAEAARKGQLSPQELRDCCILLAAFQYGKRPIQIASVRRDDVRVRNPAVGDDPIVHVRFGIVKRRDEKERLSVTVKIKREWAVLYARYCESKSAERTNETGLALFGLNPQETSVTLSGRLRSIVGHARTATDLRHTAAQRLVDRGATHEELAKFMEHKSLRTGLVYYSESAVQASRLNKALGLSSLYSEVATIARNKRISASRLQRLSSDRQIGGVMHGIAIAGIGACEVGQSLCAKNPMFSCYGCRKFMPVRDPNVHRDVLDLLRSVVKSFSDVSPDASALSQLTYTIAAVEELVADDKS